MMAPCQGNTEGGARVTIRMLARHGVRSLANPPPADPPVAPQIGCGYEEDVPKIFLGFSR